MSFSQRLTWIGLGRQLMPITIFQISSAFHKTNNCVSLEKETRNFFCNNDNNFIIIIIMIK